MSAPTPTPQSGAPVYTFAGYVLTEDRLLKGRIPIAMEASCLRILRCLVERSPEMVRSRDLRAAAWPERSTHEGALRRSISLLRRALNARRGGLRSDLIETIHKQGYRLAAHVVRHEALS